MRRRTAMIVFAAALAWPLLVGAAPRIDERAAPARAELPGKPTGPIAVDYRLAGEPAIGVPLAIAVTARVEADVTDLTIRANATSPQAVLLTTPVAGAAKGRLHTWTITVVPLAAEAGYLSVVVSGAIDGVAQARSVTISLRTPSATTTRPAAAARNDEALIALPVQESSVNGR